MDLKPTSIIILGVTGDLTAKKVMPALFNLWKKQALPPQLNIVGFGRREMDTPAFADFSRELLQKKMPVSEQDFSEFSKHLSYVQGQFDDLAAYDRLDKHLDALEGGWNTAEKQRLFYLAVPPEIYSTIFTNLDRSKIGHGWPEKFATKILVEKPFGKDQQTAQDLDRLLGTLFAEHQIYRIDHYLAKEMLQNILAFRFSNDIFENIWNRQFIEKIEIRTWETLGVESRGKFYDGVGAFRDVGQNHLLQMLALMTMDEPLDFSSQAIQLRRAQILQHLKPLEAEQARAQTFRAQYQGYAEIDGVAPNSQTETYFKIKAELDHERWRGVPIYMEAGKRLAGQIKDVTVTFRHEEHCDCPPGPHRVNRAVFSLEPEEAIRFEFWAKKPGLAQRLEKRTMDFMLRSSAERAQYVEEYEKLLADAVSGDQTLFVSTSEVQSMWKFVDPIAQAWRENAVPLAIYPPGSTPAAPVY